MTVSPFKSELSPEEVMKRALLEIKALKRKVAQLESAPREPIAIVGMSCRLPGGVGSPEDFWELLVSGRDCLSEVPADRWTIDNFFSTDRRAQGKAYTRAGYFLNDVSGFDADLFGISHREAREMDPQQRLLLELAWEAFEDSGIPMERIHGSRTGVYVGMMNQDYFQLSAYPLGSIVQHTATGYTISVASGRIAHYFGLTGPAITIDTACSSSLVALHTAATALRSGEIDSAVVCGVNLMLTPRTTILECKAGMLAEDGRSKAFDDSADGYGRGEGGGAVVLKRLSDAEACGDRLWAVLRGSAINHDGRSSGLTAPNGVAQRAVITSALQAAHVSADDVCYVEAHGTGTSLGDPIEVDALHSVYGSASRASPLLVGSVKTNIGHLEGAAGIMSVIKAALCLSHRSIPGQLHYSTPNRNVDWAGVRISVVTQSTPVPASDNRPMIGVSAFGLSGTNSHAILQAAPETSTTSVAQSRADLLVLSAAGPEALRCLSRSYLKMLSADSAPTYREVCGAAAQARSHLPYRIAIPGSDSINAKEALDAFCQSELPRHYGPQATWGAVRHGVKRALVFTGQGSQYSGMGKKLYESDPLFRQIIDEGDRLLIECPDLDFGVSIRDLMFAEAEEGSLLDDTTFAQPAIFLLEYGLAAILLECGIVPSAVVGHSVGEYVAAAVAGVFSWTDGLLFIARRAKAMGKLERGGAMLSALGDIQAAIDIARGFPTIDLAVENSRSNCVFSGTVDDLDKLMHRFTAAHIVSKRLRVSHAFHSRLMDPALGEIEAAARRLSFRNPSIPIVSNVSGAVAGSEILSPAYWSRHTRSPVKFSRCIETLTASGIRTFIEIGPRAILTSIAQRDTGEARWISTLSSTVDDRTSLSRSLGELYVDGSEITWSKVFGGTASAKARLPLYPFQREPFWTEAPSIDALEGALSERGGVVLESTDLSSNRPVTRSVHIFSLDRDTWLSGHQILGRVVAPAALYLAMMHKLISVQQSALILRNVSFSSAVTLAPDSNGVECTAEFSPAAGEGGEGTLTIFSSPSGKPVEIARASLERSNEIPSSQAEVAVAGETSVIDGREFYASLREQGYEFGGTFQPLESIRVAEGHASSSVSVSSTELHGFSLSTEILDATFHLLLAAAGLVRRPGADSLYIPSSIDAVKVYGDLPQGPIVLSATHVRAEDVKRVRGDLMIHGSDGTLYCSVEGFEARLVTRKVLFGSSNTLTNLRVSRPAWISYAPAEAALQGARIWVLDTESDVQRSLLSSCEGLGAGTIEVRRDPIRPGSAEEVDSVVLAFDQLSLSPDGGPIASYEGAYTMTLETIQAILASAARPPRVVLVTTGALPVLESDSISSPCAAGLHGLLRTAAREDSRIRYTIVDVETQQVGDAMEGLLALFLADDARSYEAAVRSVEGVDTIFTPIDSEIDFSDQTSGPFTCKADGTYVITGGLGSLGLQTARWLADRGARTIALVSRSTKKAEENREIVALREVGVDVRLLEADISTVDGGAKVRAALLETGPSHASGAPRVSGIVHSAGVLADARLLDQSWALAEKALSPKVLGLMNLLQAVELEPDGFVLCYSSAAGVIGNSGQANYAAANCALDSYAAKLRAQGVRSFVVQLGPIADQGMAAVPQIAERFRRLGIQPVEFRQGLEIVERLLLEEQPQALVSDIAWAAYGKHSNGVPPRFSMLYQPNDTTGASVLDSLSSRSKEDILRNVRGIVAEETARVLGRQSLPTAFFEQGFFDIGMDSMMAVELRNVLSRLLERELPATVVLEHASVSALAEHLASLVRSSTESEKPSSVEREVTAGPAHSAPSDPSALDQELSKLESLLAIT